MLTKKDLEHINGLIREQIEEALVQIMQVLSVVATKEDLKEFATKEDLKATKKELKADIEELRADITDIKRDIQDLKADMPTREDFQNLKKLEEIHQKELSTYA